MYRSGLSIVFFRWARIFALSNSSAEISIFTVCNPSGRSVPITSVAIDGGFWGERLRTNRERSIAHIYEQCKRTGRIDAFRTDWNPSEEVTRRDGRWSGTVVMFWDSDVAKWIEAASYVLATHPNPELDALLDGYESIAEFDWRELQLIQPLRTLRLIHHSAWLARRWHDPAFPAAFPWFESGTYWQQQRDQLRQQIDLMATAAPDHASQLGIANWGQQDDGDADADLNWDR